jgi:hypothetical protein
MSASEVIMDVVFNSIVVAVAVQSLLFILVLINVAAIMRIRQRSAHHERVLDEAMRRWKTELLSRDRKE